MRASLASKSTLVRTLHTRVQSDLIVASCSEPVYAPPALPPHSEFFLLMSNKRLQGDIEKCLRDCQAHMQVYDRRWRELKSYNEAVANVEMGQSGEIKCRAPPLVQLLCFGAGGGSFGGGEDIINVDISRMSVKQVNDIRDKLKNELEVLMKKVYRNRQQIIEWLSCGSDFLKCTYFVKEHLVDAKKEIETRHRRGKVYYLRGMSSENAANEQSLQLKSHVIWIERYIDSLNLKIQLYNAEVERATARMARGENQNDESELEAVTLAIDTCGTHLHNLENILRRYKNNTLCPTISSTNKDVTAAVQHVLDVLQNVADELRPLIYTMDPEVHVPHDIYQDLLKVSPPHNSSQSSASQRLLNPPSNSVPVDSNSLQRSATSVAAAQSVSDAFDPPPLIHTEAGSIIVTPTGQPESPQSADTRCSVTDAPPGLVGMFARRPSESQSTILKSASHSVQNSDAPRPQPHPSLPHGSYRSVLLSAPSKADAPPPTPVLTTGMPADLSGPESKQVEEAEFQSRLLCIQERLMALDFPEWVEDSQLIFSNGVYRNLAGPEPYLAASNKLELVEYVERALDTGSPHTSALPVLVWDGHLQTAVTQDDWTGEIYDGKKVLGDWNSLLRFSANTKVELLAVTPQWTYGRLVDDPDQQGWFPTSYVY